MYVEKPMQPQRLRRPPVRRGRPRSTTASCSTARSSVAATSRAREIAAVHSRQVRQAAGVQGLLLQAAVEHRLTSRCKDPPAELDFNLWLGPAPEQPYPRQPGALQLALVLGHRQRRHRQPGRPRDGRRPLGDPGRDAAEERVEPGRPLRLRRPGPDAQHAAGRVRLRRRAAGVRSPAAWWQTRTGATCPATSPTSTTRPKA